MNYSNYPQISSHEKECQPSQSQKQNDEKKDMQSVRKACEKMQIEETQAVQKKYQLPSEPTKAEFPIDVGIYLFIYLFLSDTIVVCTCSIIISNIRIC